MGASAIPTLGAALFLDRPQDMLAYVLRYYASAPFQGNNSNISQAISLANTLSRYSYDRTQITGPIIAELQAEYGRVFPDAASVSVDVTTTAVSDSLYTITISPTVTIGTTVYSVSRTLSASNGILTLTNDTVPTS